MHPQARAVLDWYWLEKTRFLSPPSLKEASLGPHAQYTHWKQTVFYLDDILTVNAKEVITGKISCAPNAKNPRDLDIVVDYEFDGSITQSSAKHVYRMS